MRLSSGEALSDISSSDSIQRFISLSNRGIGAISELISHIIGISGTSEERKSLTSLAPTKLRLTVSSSLIESVLPLRTISSRPMMFPNSPTGISPLYRITETASVVSVNAS